MLKPQASIDYTQLENTLLKKSFKLSDVKDKIEKVAFDIVRFKDDDKRAQLWQIQDADDGQYIVAIYDDEPETTKTASKRDWQVVFSKEAKSLLFFYKSDPIIKIAASNLGIPQSEVHLAARYLPSKLAENPKLVEALLSELSEPAKKMVYDQYPELKVSNGL